MQKVMITTATVFALVVSAGMSMAGPLGGNGQRGFAQDVRSSVSQAFDQQTTKTIGLGLDLSSKQDPSQKNLSSTQKTSNYGSSWSSQLPNAVVITVDDGGSHTVIFGQTSGSNLQPTPIWKYYR
ncbi:hypothetical protein [Roseovarius sp. EL26]|uniref:hypothetical protein n=1 Tax=Roseovarius sp. EL26 TaxID=2126672 RepID=UPI001C1F7125|nr:hypothetical protein [Roseovarius sp. EL26]